MNKNNEETPVKALSRERFLGLLYITELILLLLSLVIARLASGRYFPYGFSLSAENILLGLLAAVPVAVLILLATIGPISEMDLVARSMGKITTRLKQILGSSIQSLTAFDIVLPSAFAGIGEEIFFRGLLQSYVGVIGAAIVFGLLHALTPTYFVLATAIGLYFGYLYETTGNLLIPMVSHAAYDIFALYLLRLQFAQRRLE